MFDQLILFDQKLFLELNSHHNSIFDFIMWWFSNKPIWFIFYLFLAYKLYTGYPRSYLWVILFIVVTIIVSDQLCSGFLKSAIGRLRPTHEPGIMEQVHTLNNYKGGLYGFTSSHASNSFALAGFLFFLFSKRYVKLRWLLIIWASLVSYSRIYLGVHYPLDVICGGLIGFTLGWYMQNRFRYYFINYISIKTRRIKKPWKNSSRG